MKKLAILSTVAALAAFGWANDADATPLSEDGEVTCERTDEKGPGFLDDVYTVFWDGTDGADFYTVMFKCSGGPGGRQQSTDVDQPDTDVDFTAGAFNGPGGVKDRVGVRCLGQAKGRPRHTPCFGPSKQKGRP